MSSVNYIRNQSEIIRLRGGLSESSVPLSDSQALDSEVSKNTKEIEQLQKKLQVVSENTPEKEIKILTDLAKKKYMILERVSLRLLRCAHMESYNANMQLLVESQEVLNVAKKNLLDSQAQVNLERVKIKV